MNALYIPHYLFNPYRLQFQNAPKGAKIGLRNGRREEFTKNSFLKRISPYKRCCKTSKISYCSLKKILYLMCACSVNSKVKNKQTNKNIDTAKKHFLKKIKKFCFSKFKFLQQLHKFLLHLLIRKNRPANRYC